MRTVKRWLADEKIVSSLVFIIIVLLTYAPLIAKMGYYRDDWYIIWSARARGPQSLPLLLSTDRPYRGLVYVFDYFLLGSKVLNWHIYDLFWRLLDVFAFYWLVRLIWPAKKYLTGVLTVLFIVYPGFLSQPIANTKAHYLFAYGSALLSMALMLKGVMAGQRSKAVGYHLLSLVFGLNYLLLFEYMIGLEAMRLLVLGYFLYMQRAEPVKNWLQRVVKYWWPYLVMSAGFLYWRFVVFASARAATNADRLFDQYQSSPLQMIKRVVLESGNDFLDAAVFSWFQMLYNYLNSATYSQLGAALLAALAAAALCWLYLRSLKREDGISTADDENEDRYTASLLWLGALIVLFAIIPVLAANRAIDLEDTYKSYGLHPMAGAVLFITGAVFLVKRRFRQTIVLLLVGMAVTTQLLNAFYWSQFWEVQRNIWWQLSWRAPDIRKDALLFTQVPPGFALEQDYESWGPVGIIYAPTSHTLEIKAEVLNQDTIDLIKKGNPDQDIFRDFTFVREFGNTLILSMPSTLSCLHVIDGDAPFLSEFEVPRVELVAGYSDIDQIIPSGASPEAPEEVFGAEPEHTWCWYFQKASLARQVGDWEEIARLGDQALALDHKPLDRSEWMPFYEAYVNLGRLEDARWLSTIIGGNKALRFAVCQDLAAMPEGLPGYDHATAYDILCVNP